MKLITSNIGGTKMGEEIKTYWLSIYSFDKEDLIEKMHQLKDEIEKSYYAICDCGIDIGHSPDSMVINTNSSDWIVELMHKKKLNYILAQEISKS